MSEQQTEQPPGETREQIVLILVGLIGSGKSTFAEALAEHFPNFRRCNQDDLGDRRAVEDLARHSLQEGLSVCIDRTNFNAAQRRYWIDIAREVPGTLIWVIVFDTPYEVCEARLRSRTGHPTIKTPEQGMSVLARFASDFQTPRPDEGFDRVISIDPQSHPEPAYSRTDIEGILQQIRDSPHLRPSRRVLNAPHFPIPRTEFSRGRFGTLNMFWGRSFDHPSSSNNSGRGYRGRGSRGYRQPTSATRGSWSPHGRSTTRPRGASYDTQSVD